MPRKCFYNRFCMAVLAAMCGWGLAAVARSSDAISSPLAPDWATTQPAAPAEADLLADVTAVTPGKSFRLGLRLTIQPGWHAYWKHPGEAGMGTAVRFAAPEGFTIGPVHWPTPERFIQPGDILGYGYADELLLWVEITPPATLPPDRSIVLKTEADWLACREKCILGSASRTLTLNVSGTPAPANRDLFDGWVKRLPADPSQAGAPAKVELTGRPPGETDPGQFEVTATWAFDPAAVEWLAAPPDAIEIVSASLDTHGRSSRMKLVLRRAAGLKLDAAHMEVLLAAQDPAGRRRAIRVELPLRLPAQTQPAIPPKGNHHE